MGALLACLVCVLAGAPAPARSQASVEASVAVLPPRAAAVLESVDGGVQEWLRSGLAAAGLAPLRRSVVERAVAELRAGATAEEASSWSVRGEQAPALATATGASLLLYSDIRYESGQIDLRLRLHEGAGGAVVAGARVEGRLADLGTLLVQALESVTTVAGLVLPEPAKAEPRLSELGRYERTVARIARGQLASGWRELQGIESPTANALRREIQAVADLDATPISERSRLASASGTQDRSWLHVRRALVEGGDPEMVLAGADAAMARQEPELAQKLYREAVVLDPDHREAHLGLARAAVQAGQPDAALPSLERAIALDPDDPEPHEVLGELPGVPEPTRAEHLVVAGRIRGSRLEEGVAEQDFQRAGDLDRGVLATAQRNVAAFNERMGRHEQALLSYEEAAAFGDSDPELLAGLGRSRAQVGDLEGAEEAFGAALSMDAGHVESLHGMGTVMSQTGRPAEAIPLLERAASSGQKMQESRQALAMAYQAAGDPDAALATLTTGAEAGSVDDLERAELLRQAAEIQRDEGRLDDARITLEKAKAIEPFDPPIHAALAQVYEAQGDSEAARQERMQLASLQGRAIEPTSASGLPVRDGSMSGRPEDFDRLFASFPVRNPESRREIRKVAYLGVHQETSLDLLLRQWLSPFRPDLAALDAALLEGVFSRYEAQPPPEVWPEVIVGATERIVAFGTAREDVALLNDVLEVDAAFVVEIERVPDPGGSLLDERYMLRVRMVGGREARHVVIRANELAMPAGAPFRVANLRALVPLSVVLILLSLPVIRGWGTVVVKLEWDKGPATKGFFAIEIGRRPGRVKRERASSGKSKAYRYQKRTSPFRRGSASMVGPETRFRWIPAGKRYVMVHGLLLDEQSREVIGNYIEERRVEVPRGRPVEVAFDFQRRDAPLEVRVVAEEGVEIPQLPVALRGRPDSLRYVRDGSTVFHVGDGQHGILVGEDDRVHDVDVLVSEHRAALVTIRLGGEETAAFVGCPDAVEPYLQGDVAAACGALDRAGQVEVANLLRARFHEERGEAEEAARYYEAAGEIERAAVAAAECDDPEMSASRFVEAGDYGRAAEKYEEAGDPLKAAEALEAAYDYEGAIEAYRKAGASAKVLELLEKTGGYFEAGQLASAAGDEDRAIRNLQMVDIRDPDYSEACAMLARIFMGREEWDLAVHKVEEAMQVVGEAVAGLQLHEQLARALDRSGRTQEAITAWETIRKRDAQYPEAAEQIAYLRQRLAEAGTRADPEAATQVGSDSAATQPHAPGAQAEERYEILGELGRGGMGIVYKARDTRLGRVVALKRLPDNLRDHPTAVQLFLREARAAAALNHPNIVTLFDADQSADGNYYITMEMLEGLPLDQILERRGRLNARDTLRLAVQIATGLQFAHEKGVIHRDIKTSNLFFTQDKVVKIMDFGLAKMTEEVRRAATVIGGTPYYMAPEQSEGKGVDHRADLYAFGVTLFELLTGTVPFKEGDVTYHHRHTPPPDPRELVPDLPAPLAELVLRLMAKRADDRFARTAEVTAALSALARGA